MIPIQPSKEEDYFRDDKIVMDFIKLPCWTGMSTGFYNICLNSENAAREIVGLPPMDGTKFVYRPYHTFSPMFKSVNKYVNSKLNHHWFTDTCTQRRSQRNLTQYLYINYLFHVGRCITEVPSFKHIYHPLKDDPTAPKDISEETFASLFNGIEQVSNICINDNYYPDIEKLKPIAYSKLDRFIGNKSKYEL